MGRRSWSLHNTWFTRRYDL